MTHPVAAVNNDANPDGSVDRDDGLRDVGADPLNELSTVTGANDGIDACADAVLR